MVRWGFLVFKGCCYLNYCTSINIYKCIVIRFCRNFLIFLIWTYFISLNIAVGLGISYIKTYTNLIRPLPDDFNGNDSSRLYNNLVQVLYVWHKCLIILHHYKILHFHFNGTCYADTFSLCDTYSLHVYFLTLYTDTT